MRYPIKNCINKYYPEGSFTQYFGENPDLYKYLDLAGHNGIDIIAPYGEPILAPCDLVIGEIKNTPEGYGRHIRAIGSGYEWTFGHLSEISCELGQFVKEGDVIGKMGNSGFVVSGSTPYWKYNPYAGTHLHLTIRKLGKNGDPYVIYNNTTYPIANYENGYKGAIDPMLEVFNGLDNTGEYEQKQLTIISLANQVIGLLQKIIPFYENRKN